MSWRRRTWLLVGVLAGVVLGTAFALVVQPVPAPSSAAPAVSPFTSSSSSPMPLPDPSAAAEPSDSVLLAWAAGGLPDGLAERIAGAAGVSGATVVRGDLVELRASWSAAGQPVDAPADGFVIPLDAIAVDPATYPGFMPASARARFADLADGEALLGATSARLRGLGPGATLALADGSQVSVRGVVDDTLVGAAEIVLAAPALATERYIMVRFTGHRADVEETLRGVAPPDVPLRIRGPGETPFLRHGDAVLPQALVKERFGEFSYRRTDGRDLELASEWTERFVATEDIPLLGTVRCHRDFLPALAGAMAELAKRNLGYLIEAEGFAGCYAPRLTTSQEAVSRHAWGIAVDLNWPDNPVGGASTQDARLVEVLQRWGLTWGGEWLVADPAHFEHVRDP